MKITRATLKSFVTKNRENLYIKTKADFCSMTDCVQTLSGNFKKAEDVKSENVQGEYNMGIKGIWVVKNGSRNWFAEYNDGIFQGIEVSNCCGNFIVAKKISK